MKKLFSTDSKLFSIMTMLLELAEINVLFIITSLPIVTLGSAFAALYDSLYQMQKYGEGCFSVRHFFKTFRRTLKYTIVFCCMCLIALSLLIYNFLTWTVTLEGVIRICFMGIYLVFITMLCGIMELYFFMTAMSEKWTKEYIKDAFLLSLANYPYVLVMMIITASPLVILLMSGAMLAKILPLIVLFWIACPGYVCVSLIIKILKPVYPEWFQDS